MMLVFFITIAYSCSNEDQDEISQIPIELTNTLTKQEITSYSSQVQERFENSLPFYTRNYRFETVDWGAYNVKYNKNYTYITYKSFNDENENEFDLIIYINKNNKAKYFLKSNVPQTFGSKVTTENGVTNIHYTYNNYNEISTGKSDIQTSFQTARQGDELNPCDNYSGDNIHGCYEIIIGIGDHTEEDAGDGTDPFGGYGGDGTDTGGGGGDGGGGGSGSGQGSGESGEETVVTVPERIIIDKSLEDNKCIMNIYNKLGGTNFGEKYIKIFDENLDSPNLKFSLASTNEDTILKPSAPARVTHGYTKYLSKNNYLIVLNSDHIDYSLGIAHTLIHETLHATLNRKMDSTNAFQNEGEILKTEFPYIFDAYQEYTDYPHEIMSNRYISLMVAALKDFDSTYSQEYYEAIAWIGLKGTKAFNNLPQTKIDKLNKDLSSYRKNTPTIDCK